jgi:hypothetical protein
VKWAQDGGAGWVVDPLGIPSSSTLQITLTGASLGREIKKSEKGLPFHDSLLRFLPPFLTQRCSYFNRRDREIFTVAAVERMMTAL